MVNLGSFARHHWTDIAVVAAMTVGGWVGTHHWLGIVIGLIGGVLVVSIPDFILRRRTARRTRQVLQVREGVTYSADGRWRWDGSHWQPTSQPLAAEQAHERPGDRADIATAGPMPQQGRAQFSRNGKWWWDASVPEWKSAERYPPGTTRPGTVTTTAWERIVRTNWLGEGDSWRYTHIWAYRAVVAVAVAIALLIVALALLIWLAG